ELVEAEVERAVVADEHARHTPRSLGDHALEGRPLGQRGRGGEPRLAGEDERDRLGGIGVGKAADGGVGARSHADLAQIGAHRSVHLVSLPPLVVPTGIARVGPDEQISRAVILSGPWPLRVLWLILPFTVGAAIGHALDERSGAVQLVVAALAWAV